ncbi:hypothetical protein [Pedobacter arcticus]|uniref:hypothetical protein n=1 Tax=Pedobacter arcticus TaxID=752140 RepID=UPI0003181725|nr:hypothetical protein [Pedobacter arcticus]
MKKNAQHFWRPAVPLSITNPHSASSIVGFPLQSGLGTLACAEKDFVTLSLAKPAYWKAGIFRPSRVSLFENPAFTYS